MSSKELTQEQALKAQLIAQLVAPLTQAGPVMQSRKELSTTCAKLIQGAAALADEILKQTKG